MSQNIEQNSENFSAEEQLAQTIAQNTEFEIERNSLHAILKTSSIVNKYASWLLVGCGATASLLIANAGNINKYLSTENIRFSLLVLVISGLLGLLQKHIALNIEINLSIVENLWSTITDIMSEHNEKIEIIKNKIAPESTQINLSNIINRLKKVTPFYSKHSVDKYSKKGMENPLFVYEITIQQYKRQKLYAFLESIVFFYFIIQVAFSLK